MLLDLPVDNPDSIKDMRLEVWDHDLTSKDDFLGDCLISAQLLRTAVYSFGEIQDVWKALSHVESASIHVEVGWSELKTKPDPVVYQDCHLGVVSIFIDSCQNLNGLSKTGLKLPNAKVRVEVCNVSQTTETVVGATDPVFEHRMNFLVHNPLSDGVRIVVLVK